MSKEAPSRNPALYPFARTTGVRAAAGAPEWNGKPYATKTASSGRRHAAAYGARQYSNHSLYLQTILRTWHLSSPEVRGARYGLMWRHPAHWPPVRNAENTAPDGKGPYRSTQWPPPDFGIRLRSLGDSSDSAAWLKRESPNPAGNLLSGRGNVDHPRGALTSPSSRGASSGLKTFRRCRCVPAPGFGKANVSELPACKPNVIWSMTGSCGMGDWRL
jgi:hypothetical protein